MWRQSKIYRCRKCKKFRLCSLLTQAKKSYRALTLPPRDDTPGGLEGGGEMGRVLKKRLCREERKKKGNGYKLCKPSYRKETSKSIFLD